MTASSSCVRCARPLTSESTGGLCPTCMAAGDTIPRRPAVRVRKPSGRPSAAVDDTPTASLPARPAVATVTPPPVSAFEPPPQPVPSLATLLPLGYEYVRTLGNGGMGDVYLVRDTAADRLVAMKFLRSAGSQNCYERFLNEVRALARLDHPHIVRVLGHDFHRAIPYFTMEYLSGGSLAQELARAGLFPADRAARVIATVARAVHAAHQAHIVHRDIKPSNILLDESGSPRLSDFGLAKRTDLDYELTTGSGPLGTPYYMPPEQTRRGSLDARADVYGLGATLYHLLTGQPPFHGHEDALLRIVQSPPKRPRSIRPEVPLELEAICLKCLEKKPEDRYPSAEALAQDLERFLAGQAPSAPPLTHSRRLRRWVRQHATGLATAAVALLATIGLVVAAAKLPASGDGPKAPQDPRDQIRAELAAGKPAVLIGQTGQPRWHQWYLGTANFGNSPTGDKSCYFQTNEHVLLELLDDPGIEQYSVSAEVRMINILGRGLEGCCGLYFGRQPNPDPTSQEFIYAAVFRDFHKSAKPPPGAAQFQVMETLWKQQPNQGLLLTHSLQFAGLEIPLLESRPGPWRRITARVAPDLIQVLWAGEPDEQDLEVARLERDSSGTFLQIVPNNPNNPFLVRSQPPAWQSRSPFGIWVLNSSVCLRNVVVTPHPKP